ncbi:MAG: hypothetical protein OEX81_02245 [Candidatus Pacebacteria bacterium]|nr:hypothetical protein [Candidatus Paceibacterota bacterium]
MKLKNELINLIKSSFKLVSKSPFLWFFFYVFVLLGILIENFLEPAVRGKASLILMVLTVSLPALKVEFLDSVDKDKSPQYIKTPNLLFYYFKKFLFVTVFLFVLGIVFSLISNLLVYVLVNILGLISEPSSIELIRMLVFLPLAVVYFSLFHLFVVILVKAKKGILETFKLSILFIKKNYKIVSLIIILSLLIHYPISELMIVIVNKLFSQANEAVVQSTLAFVNILIELFFFAVWMVLYKKKR